MTPIFCYGSLNLTRMFGIKKESEVQEELRPFLYHKDEGGDIYLNVTFKNRQEVSQYGQSHYLVASKKGVDGYRILADFKEYIKAGQQPQQQYQQPQNQAPQGGYSSGGYGVDF